MEQLRISCIVPVFNGEQYLRPVLDSIVAQTCQPLEIIVVDDGSTDSTPELVASYGAQVRTVWQAQAGPAAGRNHGARIARGDILFFIDADVVLPADALSKVVANFRQRPDLSALFGSYDDAPAALNFLSQYRNLLHHYVHQTAREEASTFWGACGAIRREVFQAVGGFDEAYRRPCIEDIELGYRLTRAGHPIQLNKTLQVKHLKQWNAGSLLKADFFQRALPWTALILRDSRFIRDLNLGLSSRVSVALAYGLLLALLSAGWWSGWWMLAVVLALTLFSLNVSVYRFFWRKRGFVFALMTIPWHWLYYGYSGLAFVLGNSIYLFGRWGFARWEGLAWGKIEKPREQ